MVQQLQSCGSSFSGRQTQPLAASSFLDLSTGYTEVPGAGKLLYHPGGLWPLVGAELLRTILLLRRL